MAECKKVRFVRSFFEDEAPKLSGSGAHSSSGSLTLAKCQNVLCSVVAKTCSLIDSVKCWRMCCSLKSQLVTFKCYVNELLSPGGKSAANCSWFRAKSLTSPRSHRFFLAPASV